MGAAIRAARRGDCDEILAMVRELAEYERVADTMDATADRLEQALFGPAPRVFCEIAEGRGEPVGYALWFYTFSSFRGQHGIWLEDLFVRPAHRGQGIGRQLLAHLARRCVMENCPSLEWNALDWNAPSIAFYQAHGAEIVEEWTSFRISGPALWRLAETVRAP